MNMPACTGHFILRKVDVIHTASPEAHFAFHPGAVRTRVALGEPLQRES